MQTEYISEEGYNNLNLKIKELKNITKEILAQITLNRQQESGDESENSELIRLMAEINAASKKEQELTGYCARCTIISLSEQVNDGKVRFGNIVKVIECELDKASTYQILGEKEADPKNLKISYKSPLGKTLIGKEVGDIVDVETPSGFKEYEIVEINVA
ncbi:Transcription elongation factor GreA [Vibrio chagasii]|nr:Transcription elongation factor GreA [Vibrio chagasii]